MGVDSLIVKNITAAAAPNRIRKTIAYSTNGRVGGLESTLTTSGFLPFRSFSLSVSCCPFTLSCKTHGLFFNFTLSRSSANTVEQAGADLKFNGLLVRYDARTFKDAFTLRFLAVVTLATTALASTRLRTMPYAAIAKSMFSTTVGGNDSYI